ncbi:calcium and integrin-binding family member 2-like [Lytechinus variegatus]|uniref:calcium and integrin-binding family member 2-like n=1 Tax=Lytechinus variegatus TaxID=7654 RepID=UPI001BB27FB2|nr:calcium and integrin-binding family member 2-like [Lytechinus variegatus]
MGGSHSVFTEAELDDYQELTFFSKKEILHVHKRFHLLDPEAVRRDKNACLPMDKILELPELKVNPFKDRICKVFSSTDDGSLTFEDFLDMMSVFSDSAPKSMKAEYAFRIYDFDEDDFISSADIREMVNRLTGEQQITDDDMQHLINNIFEEADLDDDDALSFAEFEHVISKAPDFMNTFRIRL